MVNFGITNQSIMPLVKPASLFLAVLVLLFACKKEPGGATISTPGQLYGDSVIYLKSVPGGGDHIVYPVNGKKGTYSSFPDGLEIDDETGAINVSESETGLRYRVTYRSPSGETSSSTILVAGINYPDKYYRLSQGDSISFPIYNGNGQLSPPGGSFDEGNLANAMGAAVLPNGQINLAKTIRNGFFGATPRNDEQDEIEIAYRLNDGSGRSLQKIKVILYYYRTLNDVPDYLKEILAARQGMIFGVNPTNPIFEGSLSGRVSNLARKPRPPCVIVIAQ
jgi:hypothetical protein